MDSEILKRQLATAWAREKAVARLEKDRQKRQQKFEAWNNKRGAKIREVQKAIDKLIKIRDRLMEQGFK